jgi:hypothetical protein
MDLIGWVVESRVICGVEAEAYDVFSTHASVMRKVSFTQTVEPSIISGTANHFDNLV